MPEIKLSYIIPIYNGSAFIAKTLQCLLTQDIPHNEYEIVCVDDFSTDNSVELIKIFQQKYKNIKLVQHSKNLYVGSACKSGVENAKGDYIWIIGQDDTIKNNSLKYLLSLCEKYTLDVITFNYSRVDCTGKIINTPHVFDNSECLSGLDYINKYFKENFCDYLLGYEWRALFRRNFLRENNINFNEGAIFEDTVYLFKAMIFANKIMSLSEVFYYYKVNESSITNDFNSNIKGLHIYHFAFIAGGEVLQLSKDLKSLDINSSKMLHLKTSWYFNSLSSRLIKTTVKEKIQFYKLIRANRQLVDDRLKYANNLSTLLCLPVIGFVFSVLLIPIYSLKRKTSHG